MTDAWRIVARAAGGPDVLERGELVLADPLAGEVRVRIEAIGVNFIDTYHRTGFYPRTFPSPIGQEAAGVVEAVGAGVEGLKVGERVAFLADGAYATHATIPARAAFALPPSLTSREAAAILLKGLTGWMLAEGVRPVTPGMRVLLLAAAGGVGTLLVPWIKALGGTLIAHAGTADKAARAKAAGADHALHDDWASLAASVRALTDGKGVDLALDGVGHDSWAATLGSMARRGMIASFGSASGAVPPLTTTDLLRGGSLFLTRPSLFDWIIDPTIRATAWGRLTALIEAGVVRPTIGLDLPLADAAEAHRRLEARATTGSIILIP